MSLISKNLLKISCQIKQTASDITLIAVSKYRSSDEIIQAITAGQMVFGENKVQEAMHKWTEIKQHYPNIELHLIGALQTNKVSDAVKIFDTIQVMDRPKLAQVLLKEMQKQNKYPKCLIQVNTGAEPQKAGVLPNDADDFITQCIKDGLPIEGLMCIPPAEENPTPHFKLLKNLCDKHNLPICSMGMSADYLSAIQHGATHIRVGTAIFGERPEP
jgi:pyridoxal phosphate enzyme (YggS family)